MTLWAWTSLVKLITLTTGLVKVHALKKIKEKSLFTGGIFLLSHVITLLG